MLFRPDDLNFFTITSLPRLYFSLPLGLVYKIYPKKDAPRFWTMRIKGKDCRCIKLYFPCVDQSQGFINYVNNYVSLSVKTPFAVAHYQGMKEDTPEDSGWNLYNLRKEYERIGFKLGEDSEWRISNFNDNYEVSKTYPNTAISDSVLTKVAQFRTKGRIPSVVWKHSETGAVLNRSSQVLAGLKQNRSTEDEMFLGTLAKFSDVGKGTLHIYDARPYLNAMSQKVT
eukprot:CAMPEP_0114991634 /NCGR_PEP_ID=MMETSP0216-20121206/11487_1 /TAXON_ID=223996 /ORGANISM="Protocruzia adherens, Strain Boccale" /LENGTH=226 /DNA_ID=CAMNT_0002354995 /DNA_START=272 /DNA_END=948 /DNA_ORIENTATION=-